MSNVFGRVGSVLLAVLVMIAPVLAAPDDGALAAAQEFAKAVMTEDVEAQMKLLPPTLFVKPGDRDRLRLLKLRDKETAFINRDKYLSFDVKPPIQTAKISKYTVVVLPYVSLRMLGGEKLQASSSLIAMAEEGSGNWWVLDGTGQSAKSLKVVIPGYAGNLKLPRAAVKEIKG